MASASLLDYRGTSLYAEDVNTLSPGQWLNDQVIAFAMDFISEEVVPSTRKVALCHPGTVMVARFEEDLDDLRASISHLRLPEQDLVLLPVNNNPYGDKPGGSHWSLVACFRSVSGDATRLVHLDSHTPLNEAVALEVAQRFWPVLHDIAPDAEATATKHSAFPGLEEAACPQQSNSADCGVFVMRFAEELAKGSRVEDLTAMISEDDATAHRRLLLDRIRGLADAAD